VKGPRVRQALGASVELDDLGSETLDALARLAELRPLSAGQDVPLDEGLGWVVSGAVQLRRRGPNRQAPIVSDLPAGGLLGGEPPELLTRAVCVQPGAWAHVSGPHLAGLRQPHAELGRRLASRTEVLRQLPELVLALRRSRILSHVPPGSLHEVLRGARVHSLPAVTTIASEGSGLQAVGLVLSGEVLLRTGAATVRVLGPGDIWGDVDLVAGRELPYCVGTGASRVRYLVVPVSRWLACLARSSRLRRAALAGGYGSPDQRKALVARAQEASPQALGMTTVSGLPAPATRRLLGWLAESCASHWGDRTVLVSLQAATTSPQVALQDVGRGRLVRVTLPPDRPLAAWPDLQKRVAKAHTCFLDPGGESVPEPWAERVARTLTIDHMGPPGGPGLPLPVYRLGRAGPVPPGALRVPRQLLDAAGRDQPLEALDLALQESLARLARCATDRRVGLALGGGGALALAHLPLIRALAAAGVPLDLVSGTSGGSVVAAFYAAEGLSGLDHLVEVFPELGRIARSCVHSSAPLEEAVDRMLGRVALGDLEVPFLPVVVDIDRACQETLVTGTLGLGVRASGALPGPFAPAVVHSRTPDGDLVARRYVDGGVLNLVPDDALYAAGAAVAIASQAIGPPPPRPPERLPDDGSWRAGAKRVLQAASPARRLDDALRSAYLMMSRAPVQGTANAAATFVAPGLGLSPLDWGRPAEVLDQLARDDRMQQRLEETVTQARGALRALQWRKGKALPGGWSVVAEVTRTGG